MNTHEHVDYDAEADTIYVALQAADVDHTTSLDDHRLLDIASDGSLIGVEFIDVSGGVDTSDLPLRRHVEQLIVASRLPVKLLA
jgi:uncharacterized protein YuzE